jgi:hypothetical protein
MITIVRQSRGLKYNMVLAKHRQRYQDDIISLMYIYLDGNIKVHPNCG